ncbi:MAG: GDP-mannose 4,6-dehydratase [Chlamydiae bacterium]|nr:GDP-mannose 4,6-dehydratase [Chlamydiota bacterium]MBI3266909.1 GDP-mannose 4,6-dehydratase [Chlamydiota bacterium]
MKVFITGGAGFIGSHLAEALLKQNHHIYVMDDLSTGSIENIEHLKAYPNFHYIIESIMNYSLLCEWIDRSDVVYHLAAAVGVRLIVDSPVRTIETNIRGTEKVLDAANMKGKKVILASTSEVYGKNNKIPFKEDDDMVLGPTTRSRWSYACSKAIDEFLALAYWHEKKLPVVIVRLFNTVGPRQTGRYGMVIPRFVQQALAGEALTVYGDGSQSRSFCDVEDVTKALIDLSLQDKAVGEVFNIGSQEEISIQKLAERVIRLSGSSSKVEFVPYEKAYAQGFEDMHARVPDISKVKKIIQFEPKISLDGILKRVIEYFKSKV